MKNQPAAVIESFFHTDTQTISHLLYDPDSRHAALIDPVLDFDAAGARTQTHSAEEILARITQSGLTLRYVLETHAHADHLSAAPFFRDALGAQVGIGRGITAVQQHFKAVFGLADGFNPDGRDFDLLLDEGQILPLGSLAIEVISTPGHTPDGLSYRIGDAVFIGDTLFAPDVGSARCDFPGGSPEQLFASIQRLLALPEHYTLYLCHDYPPNGRELNFSSTVADQRTHNIHLQPFERSAYCTLRRTRDAKLPVPHLLLPALQVNIRAGRLPPTESDGYSYLRLPLNRV